MNMNATTTTKTTLDSLPLSSGDLPTRYDRWRLLDYIRLFRVADSKADSAAQRGDRDLMEVCILAKIAANERTRWELHHIGGMAAAW